MAKSANRNLLSIAAFLMILVISILFGYITDLWQYSAPLFVGLCGVWVVVLAEMQAANPLKYMRTAFSLAGWGVLMAAVGSAWALAYYNRIYAIVLFIVVFAVLLIASAMRRK
jgi:uncharacterized membrane protein AbrB (regulator of aidB expression)